jgi:hypothetical protein
MRKAMHCILGLAAILATSPAARAQVMLDISKVTCDQWVKYQVANPNSSPCGSAVTFTASAAIR